MRIASSLAWCLAGAAWVLLTGCASWHPDGWQALVARDGPPASAGLLADVADPGSGAKPKVVHPTLPRSAQVSGVPFFAQTEFHCGPAALAMVLGHAGSKATPEALAPQSYLPARQGSLQIEILAAARRQGLMATRIQPSLEGLLRELAGGRPVMVLQNLGLAMAPAWHYAVVIGYDLDTQEVVLHTGTRRAERMGLRTFGHTWARSQHWGFVVHLPGIWPATVDAARALESALAIERVGRPDLAHAAYAAGHQRWPEDLPWLAGLGNTAYAEGHLDEAAQWFRQAATQHASGAAWLNLAITLHRQGALDQAVEALRRAQASDAGAWVKPADDLLASWRKL